jgi:16S rRNA (cytidine1402-2'-O)-methyltransferase
MSSYVIGAQSFAAPPLAPGLYLVATPIGNLADVTLRALGTMAGCDVVYCEDTRITLRLMERYAIKTPLKVYHEHNGEKVRPKIQALLLEGKSVALVSDAGTPLISDPGYKLVEAARAVGAAVTSVPGASAVLTGVQLSGLPTDRFCFLGFFPEKSSQRRKLIETLKQSTMTSVFYESPHRVCETLSDIAAILGDRHVCAARELTKMHEEVLRGTAASIRDTLMQRASIKGEFVLILAAAPHDDAIDEDLIEYALTEALASMSASKAAQHVAKACNLPREDIYARILKRKKDGAA